MQKKSNLWLVIVVVIVLIALLWPVLRRGKTPAELTSDNESSIAGEEDISISDDISLVSPDDLSLIGDRTGSTVAGSNSVPSAVSAPASLSLKVFFGNQVRSPETWQCATVYPVVRTVANTPAVARAALTELINGPRPSDSSAGFFTSINPGVTIKQLTINDGVARVDFGSALVPDASAPCLRDGVRAQITETLKQFSTVRSAIISVNGVLF